MPHQAIWFRTKVIAATVAPQAINDARNVIPTLSQRFGYFDSRGRAPVILSSVATSAPHAGAAAVLVDELDADGLQNGSDFRTGSFSTA